MLHFLYIPNILSLCKAFSFKELKSTAAENRNSVQAVYLTADTNGGLQQTSSGGEVQLPNGQLIQSEGIWLYQNPLLNGLLDPSSSPTNAQFIAVPPTSPFQGPTASGQYPVGQDYFQNLFLQNADTNNNHREVARGEVVDQILSEQQTAQHSPQNDPITYFGVVKDLYGIESNANP